MLLPELQFVSTRRYVGQAEVILQSYKSSCQVLINALL